MPPSEIQLEAYLERLEPVCWYLLETEMHQAHAEWFYVSSLRHCGFEFHGCVAGLTHPSLAQIVRSEIGSRWSGNGPAIAINAAGCVELADEFPELPYWAVNAIVAHEVAHVALRKPLFTPLMDDRRFADFQRLCVRQEAGKEVPEPDLKQTDYHGREFIQTLLHAADRMRRVGLPVHSDYLMDWDAYGIERPTHLEALLLPEVDRLIDLPLSQVAAHEPRQEFTRLLEPEAS